MQYVCVCVYTDTWDAHFQALDAGVQAGTGAAGVLLRLELLQFLCALQVHHRRLVLSNELLEVSCFRTLCCCQAAAGGGRGLLVWGWRAAHLPLVLQLQLHDGVEVMSPDPYWIQFNPCCPAMLPQPSREQPHGKDMRSTWHLIPAWLQAHSSGSQYMWFKLKYTMKTCV